MNDMHDDELIADSVSKGYLEPRIQGDEFRFYKGENIGEVEGMEEAFEQAQQEEAQQIIDDLVEQGLVEAVGLNDSGEVVYQATEYGRSLVEDEMVGVTQDIVETEDGGSWFIPGHLTNIRATQLVLAWLDEQGTLEEYDEYVPFTVELVRGAWEELENGLEYFNYDANEPWTKVSV